MNDKALRDQMVKVLDWAEAHVPFDKAVKGIPASKRGVVPPGWEHSIWQLVEHIRLAQHDILDFSRNAKYREMKWPDDYWPASAAPGSDAAWKKSLARVRADRKALQQMAADRSIDLTAKIPHGSGQTVLRELLLVADHTAYHVGQIVLIRQLLGIWKTR